MTWRDAFAAPAAWPLLLLGPIVLATLLAKDRRRAAAVGAILGPRGPMLAAEVRAPRRKAMRSLGATTLVLAIVAWLQPVWGSGDHPVVPRGVDAVIALDVSKSMLARDVPEGRLATARREIAELAARARGDRLALVVFAGEARVIAPLTEDLEAITTLAAFADPLSVDKGGTDVGAAIDNALTALEGANGDHAAIILVTDGEDLGTRAERAADACRARKIAVHAVAIGTADGGKIPVDDGAGGAFLRDRSGNEVVTAPDVEALNRIAKTTGGECVVVEAGAGALVSLYERRIRPMAQRAFDARASRERTNRYQWPLGAACLLGILLLGWSDRRRA